jgi:hypothetical protein
MDSDLPQLAFQELLLDTDIATIINIRHIITLRYQRCNRLLHFRECITILCSFVDQQRDDDWKRALVTGICPCGDLLAVNNTRLQSFMKRCKSSINDLFSKLKYETMAINHENQGVLFKKIPYLQSHCEELRQWTFRTKGNVAVKTESGAEVNCERESQPIGTLRGDDSGWLGWEPFADQFF